MGEVTSNYIRWWPQMRDKYKWEDVPGGKYEIDFDTCEVVLVKP